MRDFSKYDINKYIASGLDAKRLIVLDTLYEIEESAPKHDGYSLIKIKEITKTIDMKYDTYHRLLRSLGELGFITIKTGTFFDAKGDYYMTSFKFNDKFYELLKG